MNTAVLILVVLGVVLTETCEGNVHFSNRVARAVTGTVSFTKYMTYDEVAAYLRGLQQKYPKLVTVASAGKTVEGRDMLYARVSTGGSNNNVMLVDALMHAREWITLPSVLYFLQQITEFSSQNSALLSGLDVVVMPILNPDGYEYSRTTDRLWRKNRGPTPSKNKTCVGVDLNRNFGYHWADFKTNDGASADPCDLLYAGPSAASEPETRNFQSLALKLNQNKRLKMYVNIHSPEQSIYVPWGYSTSAPKVPDLSQLITIQKEANSALVKAGSKPYTLESMAASYPATGVVSDWVRGGAGVKQSFCLELPAGLNNKYEGFDVPTGSILPISRQVFEALKVFAKYAKAPLSQ